MSQETAKLVAQEIRESGIYRHLSIQVVPENAERTEYSVKVRDGNELIAKFDGGRRLELGL